MYCSSCGVAVAPSLNYCNHCGAKLTRDQTAAKSSEVKPGMVIPAMVFVFVFGLIAITLLTGVMKAELGFEVAQILAFTSLSFLILLGLEGVFIALLFRRPRRDDEVETVKLKERTTNELEAAQQRMLTDAVPSVTEHTTRAFAPVHDERGSK